MKDENRLDLRRRTRAFALAIVRFYVKLPKTTESQILGKQVLRSGTSIGAHYHEAYRAKSNADFISKIEGALQEAEETSYWLEIMGEAVVDRSHVEPLIHEVNELIAIFVSVVRKVKSHTENKGKR